MPTNRTCGYFFCKASSSGISLTHGAHQVAQKLTTIGWPFQLASDCVAPFRSGICNCMSPATGSLASAGAEDVRDFCPSKV
ncbi:hypothetical protein D3C78_1597440 [compost metagenome]